jgi:hypothetical protein
MGPVGPSALHTDTATTHAAPKALVDAVAKLNDANAVGPDNELQVVLNGHRMSIQVVNRETREVVEHISPPSIFRMLSSV